MARPTSLAAMRQSLVSPQVSIFNRTNSGTTAGRIYDAFGVNIAGSVPPVGTLPTGPRICDANTVGAMGLCSDQPSTVLALSCVTIASNTSGLIFYDRLLDAPVSLTASGVQAVGSADITRGTGEMVFAYLANWAALATNSAQVLTIVGNDHTGAVVNATISLPANAFASFTGRVVFATFPTGKRGLKNVTSVAWDSPPTATPTDATLVLGRIIGAATAQIADTQLVGVDRFRAPMNVDGNACVSVLTAAGGAGTGVMTFEGLWV